MNCSSVQRHQFESTQIPFRFLIIPFSSSSLSEEGKKLIKNDFQEFSSPKDSFGSNSDVLRYEIWEILDSVGAKTSSKMSCKKKFWAWSIY